ncbi:short-subunit dehydrogenase [Metabacillus crassostreae]|uniref:SDR family NAD(P)-dependent oxidoreductase n=1 Tax=Metabacillus crassostreae TaxID=929098 RepID=UPI00195D6431|nr:SDR family oxidoreductase [Metabacillus crassostreae]MBM7604527.1 short-subunit dehydrogenase [Metabacillus crassostreae]
MNTRIQGCYVAITGASGGIGEKIAIECAKQGAHVILLARREELLATLADRISKDYGVSCYYYPLDVQKLESIQSVFSKIESEVGQIDILVNNAGFGIFNDVLDSTFDEMKSMFEVNVYGLIASTKMVLPQMIKRKKGHIINIASQAGKIATPKSSLYSASKHAVLGFTNSLRFEVKPSNIYVTSVNPGPIKTNFFNIADEKGDYVKNVERWMLDPNKVARIIVASMLTPKREINLPGWMNAGSTLYQVMPRLFERIAGRAFYKK